LPFAWRGWWDFGTGALGDMACHVLNMAFLALDLGLPTSISARSSDASGETAPLWSIIRYEFPARGDQPAVTLTWYDGGRRPPRELVGEALSANGSVLIGDRGKLYATDDFGSTFVLLPREAFSHLQPKVEPMPEVTHHREWIATCKGGSAGTLANFDFASRLTESVLLGNVALRAGQPIDWDAAAMKATNCPAAARFIERTYRAGWTLWACLRRRPRRSRDQLVINSAAPKDRSRATTGRCRRPCFAPG
jgi:hypothetical protein